MGRLGLLALACNQPGVADEVGVNFGAKFQWVHSWAYGAENCVLFWGKVHKLPQSLVAKRVVKPQIVLNRSTNYEFEVTSGGGLFDDSTLIDASVRCYFWLNHGDCGAPG